MYSGGSIMVMPVKAIGRHLEKMHMEIRLAMLDALDASDMDML